MISPRLKVEASYLLTVMVEDKKNNLSVGRTIYLIVQTLQDDFHGGLLAQVLPSDPDTSSQYSCQIQRGPRNIFQVKIFHYCCFKY